MLAKLMAEHHGFECTVLFSQDPETGEIDPDNQFEDGDVRGTNPFSIITTDPTDETWFTDF